MNIFIECDCHGEALTIEKHEEEYWFSFWERGFGFKKELSFKEKIRMCLFIFKNGKPYTDMLIFDKSKIEKIVEFLKEDK